MLVLDGGTEYVAHMGIEKNTFVTAFNEQTIVCNIFKHFLFHKYATRSGLPKHQGVGSDILVISLKYYSQSGTNYLFA